MGTWQGASLAIPDGATGEVDLARLRQQGSGTVTFALYANPQCTGSPVFTSTKPVTNRARPGAPVDSVAVSDPVTQQLRSGTYYWTDAYSGDGNNEPSTSSCGSETLTVGAGLTTTQVWPRTLLRSQGASIAIPDGATGEYDTAKLSQQGSGTVTFALYANSQCAGSPVFTSTRPVTSRAVFPGGPVDSYATSEPVTRPLRSGTYNWTAAYSGDSQNPPSTSPCGSETLTVGSPSRIVPGGAFISVRAATLAITCSVPPCGLTITLTLPAGLRASLARRPGKTKPRVITLARGTVTITKRGAQKVRIPLTVAGRRFVESHHGRVTVNVAMAMTVAGHTAVSTHRLTIKITKRSKRRPR